MAFELYVVCLYVEIYADALITSLRVHTIIEMHFLKHLNALRIFRNSVRMTDSDNSVLKMFKTFCTSRIPILSTGGN